jgi:hypothetical protein
MTDDILSRLMKMCSGHTHSAFETCNIAEAADEIASLREQLKRSQAERDHHLKWSKNYEAEVYKLRDQIKKNSN